MPVRRSPKKDDDPITTDEMLKRIMAGQATMQAALQQQFNQSQAKMQQQFNQSQEKILEKLETLTTQVKEVAVRVEVLEKETCKKVELAKLATVLRAEIEEEKEKIRRINNLFVFGIPETEEGEATFYELMTTIAPEIYYSHDRIGDVEKCNERPIKLCFNNEQDKRKVRSSCKKLKGRAEFTGISVCPDLTKKQRENERILRSRTKRGQQLFNENSTEGSNSNKRAKTSDYEDDEETEGNSSKRTRQFNKGIIRDPQKCTPGGSGPTFTGEGDSLNSATK